MPPGTILLTPVSTKIERQRKRPWQQNDVVRRGLPCAAAFANKVQSRTLNRVVLELFSPTAPTACTAASVSALPGQDHVTTSLAPATFQKQPHKETCVSVVSH
jgi:hypothetical protein